MASFNRLRRITASCFKVRQKSQIAQGSGYSIDPLPKGLDFANLS